MNDPVRGVALFDGISDEERERLVAKFRRLRVLGDETLIHEGDPADDLYIAISGRFDVYRNGESEPVARIGPGELIGEIAYFAGGMRTASVVASRDSEVLVLSRTDFEALAAEYPHLNSVVAKALAKRLSAATETLRPIPRAPAATLFVCASGDAPVPEEDLRRLETCLARYVDVRCLRADDALREAGARDADDPALLRFLHSCEERHDIVLFVAEPGPGDRWCALTSRQSDAALILAVDTDPAHLGERETLACMAIPAQRRRLLVTARAKAPASAWLHLRDVGSHHQFIDDADVASVARFVAGRARGLVLGGGGALCGAHIGTYFALCEAGCVFDSFGGASAGGAIAAALAKGKERRDMVAVTKDIFLTARAFRKWTVPRHALLDPATFDRKLREHYSDEPLEDLRRSCFMVVSDLSLNGARLLRRGPTWEAVRATCAIPALLPPFIDAEGRVLLDGGVTDNLPVLPMQDSKTGPNAAIVLALPYPKRSRARYTDYPRRSRQFAETVLPFLRRKPHPPRLAPMLARTILLAANSRAAESIACADLSLTPPIPDGMGILDWHRFEAHEAQAHDWARREIETLPDEVLAPFRD